MLIDILALVVLIKVVMASRRPIVCALVYGALPAFLGMMSGWPTDAVLAAAGVNFAIGIVFFWLLERTDGTALYSLLRNVGSAIGISVTSVLITQNTQIVHSQIAEHVTPFSRWLQTGAAYLVWNSATAACSNEVGPREPGWGDPDPELGVTQSALEQRAYVVSLQSDELTVIDLDKLELVGQVETRGSRNHWYNAQHFLVAGGGFQRGCIVGSTDKYGAEVSDKYYKIPSLARTIYHLLGIDADQELQTPDGRPLKIVLDDAPLIHEALV